jgi:dihydroorotase-like cyclic amidohydrolase
MRYTSIHLPGLARLNLLRQGPLSVQDMCDLIRANAARRNGPDDAQILDADDRDFHVESFQNKFKQRSTKVLQKGKPL